MISIYDKQGRLEYRYEGKDAKRMWRYLNNKIQKVSLGIYKVKEGNAYAIADLDCKTKPQYFIPSQTIIIPPFLGEIKAFLGERTAFLGERVDKRRLRLNNISKKY